MEKKIKGRKRHIITDTQGHLLLVEVHAANIHDTIAGPSLIEKACKKYDTLDAFCGDAGYRGTTKNYVENELKKRMDISQKIKPKWEVLPVRWIVERTFGWLNNYRRLSKDYESDTSSAESFVMIAHTAVLLRRVHLS